MAFWGDLVHAELYKLLKRKTLALCLAFVLAIEMINGFLHGGDQIKTMTLLMEIIGLITCALFAGLFVCTDFSSRTIYHILTSGKSRVCVWLGKYLAYFAACFVLLLVNVLAANISLLLFRSDQLALSDLAWQFVLGYSTAGVIYDLCLVSLFFLIAMQIKESGLTIAIAVVLVGLMVANSQLLWTDRLLPVLAPQANFQSIPISNFLLLWLLPGLAALMGIGLFKRCRL